MLADVSLTADYCTECNESDFGRSSQAVVDEIWQVKTGILVEKGRVPNTLVEGFGKVVCKNYDIARLLLANMEVMIWRMKMRAAVVVTIADCPPNSAVNRRRPGFSGCCLSCLERSATARHGCRISECLLQSPQDSSL